MKLFYLFILPLVITSCCLGNRKCQTDNYNTRFRIIDKTTGKDLVFGPDKVYDKNTIRFYSLNGTDTIYHHYGADANSNPGQDSLLYVSMDYRKLETVFVRLSNTDRDTMAVTYPLTDASPCCADYNTAKPVAVNNIPLEQITGGIFIIKK